MEQKTQQTAENRTATESIRVTEMRAVRKIPELGIEITLPQAWTKPYNEIVVPEGFRLAHNFEIDWIIKHINYKKIVFPDISKDIYFIWCYSERKTESKGIVVKKWSYLHHPEYKDLNCSHEDGKVIFVRDLK